MNPEAQRIAIAEACGWKLAQFEGAASSFYEHPSKPYEYTFKRLEIPGPILPDNRGLSDHDQLSSWGVPDYLSDLNAMYEAEKVLDDTGPDSKWRSELEFVCKTLGGMLRATAAQRAEAFLKTIGKWDEQQPN